MAFDHSRRRWFGTCSCKPVPRGLPSSVEQQGCFELTVFYMMFSSPRRRGARSSAKRSRDAHTVLNVLTKCSLVWNDQHEIGHSLKAASVRRELEASLRRLRVDVIDLYQIHWPDPEPEMEDGWQTLAQLQKEGKVRYIGVSNFNVAQMKQVARIAPITSLQPNYNIVTRDIEKDLLPFCRERHIGVIVYSPMKSGLLTAK